MTITEQILKIKMRTKIITKYNNMTANKTAVIFTSGVIENELKSIIAIELLGLLD